MVYFKLYCGCIVQTKSKKSGNGVVVKSCGRQGHKGGMIFTPNGIQAKVVKPKNMEVEDIKDIMLKKLMGGGTL